MINLHEELSADVTPACKLCAYLASIPPLEADAWDNELRLPLAEIPHVAVQKALDRRGIVVSQSSIARHRSRHV